MHKIQVQFLCIFALDFCAMLHYNKDDGEEWQTLVRPPPQNERRLFVPVQYKIDILATLKGAGYSSTRIRNEKIMGQTTLTQLRHGELVSWKNVGTICRLLNCQPGDILEYIPDGEKDQAGE